MDRPENYEDVPDHDCIGTSDHSYLYCPYCNYKHDDMWEEGLEDGTEEVVTCSGCGKDFVALFSLVTEYEGFKIDESDALRSAGMVKEGEDEK